MDQKNKQRKSERNEDKELLKAYLNQYYAGRSERSLKDGLKISGKKWLPL